VPLASIAMILFLIFLDRALRRLRPVAVAHSVAEAARKTIINMASSLATQQRQSEPLALHDVAYLNVYSRRAGVIQAVDFPGLIAWAERYDCILMFRHGLGDFVASSAQVVSVFGAGVPAGSDRQLLNMIFLGREGTNEQDLSFSLRVMVDMANKALSPGINDPTTASQVLNYLEDTLALLGRVPHLNGTWEIRDGNGASRLILPMPGWDEFLALSLTEIREYGATSLQVMRRLRALLERLLESVRPEYRQSVREQIDRLDATVARQWQGTEDYDLALVADHRGLGGPSVERSSAPLP
jgi:uncharacterized membrane protein